MRAHGAKHLLSFVMLRKYQDPSDPSRSPIISPVPQPMSFTAYMYHNLHSLQKVVHPQNRDTAWRPIKHLVDIGKDNKGAPKPVTRHLNHPCIPVYSISLLQESIESCKTLEQKFIFSIRHS